MPKSAAEVLRALLAEGRMLAMPCCFDALSARLIQDAGFAITLMSGFAVSATRLAGPDRGLLSYGEMLDQARGITQAVTIPVLGDGDTGYGNAMNVRRTVEGYALAGLAAVMIEDQVAPKRCGHTAGKAVVERGEALARIRAAVDAREALQRERGRDILILARTDARAGHGLDEALWRCAAFKDLGADILFVEAPRDATELARVPAEVPGHHLANMLEGGDTPHLPAVQLEEMGYALAAYPLGLLSAAIKAMRGALADLNSDGAFDTASILAFEDLQEVLGFSDYDRAAETYRS